MTAHLCFVLLFRSQTDNEGNVTAEASTGGVGMDSALYVKTGQPALEDLSGMSLQDNLITVFQLSKNGLKQV